jgi:hypothetical protein
MPVNKYLSTNYQQFDDRDAKCKVCEVCKPCNVNFSAQFEQIAYFAWIAFCTYHT